MRPDPKAPRRSGPRPRIRTTQKLRGQGPLLQKQHGFGLVAAMFLIIVIAGAIAAMWRISATQTATSSLALQQARAYQAARAGLEWEYGIFSMAPVILLPFKYRNSTASKSQSIALVISVWSTPTYTRSSRRAWLARRLSPRRRMRLLAPPITYIGSSRQWWKSPGR